MRKSSRFRNALTSTCALAALILAAAGCSGQETPQPPAVSQAAVPGPTTTNSGDSVATTAEHPAQVYKGGSVQPPVVIHMVNPKYSKQARKAKFSGQVIIALIVDKEGRPQKVHVLRGVGMGLDEEALKAVQQYKFRPAMQNGKPVAVYLNVAVEFQMVGRD